MHRIFRDNPELAFVSPQFGEFVGNLDTAADLFKKASVGSNQPR